MYAFAIYSMVHCGSAFELPGFLITTPPSVCVPDVIGALACGFQKQNKKIVCIPAITYILRRRDNVSAFSYMVGQTNNSGLMSILYYMMRQTK